MPNFLPSRTLLRTTRRTPSNLLCRAAAPLSPPVFEPVEARQLLAADLGVGFRAFGALPATLVPGDRIALPTVFTNQGDRVLDGDVEVRYFLSADTNIDTGDKAIGDFRGLSLTLNANASANRSDILTIPDVAPGRYFFLVQVIPEDAIGDLNQTNNSKFSTSAFDFKWMFGDFDGRTNVTMTIAGADSVTAVFGLTGGGTGSVVKNTVTPSRFDLTLTNTTASSRLGINASGGTGANANLALINNLTVTGSLSTLDGFRARLLGNVSVTGTAGFVRFKEVQTPGSTTGASEINIMGTGVNTDFEFGPVTNLVLKTMSGINSLRLTSWTDSDAAGDHIDARFITTLNCTGTFQPSLNLTGRPGVGSRTLDSVTIGGLVGKGAWLVNGRAGTWTIATTFGTWSAQIKNNIISLNVSGLLRGTIAAKSFGAITVGGLKNAFILSGANLGADARRGGAGDNADTFGAGPITSLKVNGSVMNSIVASGVNPTDGIYKNGDDVLLSGQINSVVVTGTASANSRFLARRFPPAGPYRINGLTVNPATDARFKRDSAFPPTITDILSTPLALPSTLTLTLRDIQGVDVSTLGNGNFILSGPGGVTMPLTFIMPPTPLSNGPIITGQWSIPIPGGTWDASENGTYQILVAANSIKDIFGNFTPAGTIATFTIAL